MPRRRLCRKRLSESASSSCSTLSFSNWATMTCCKGWKTNSMRMVLSKRDATKRTTNFHPTTRLISVTRNGKKTSATIMTMRNCPSIRQEGAIMNRRKSPWATPARLWMTSGHKFRNTESLTKSRRSWWTISSAHSTTTDLSTDRSPAFPTTSFSTTISMRRWRKSNRHSIFCNGLIHRESVRATCRNV